MQTEIPFTSVERCGESDEALISTFVRLERDLVLVGSGFREGALFGLFVDRTMANQVLLARVSPWPDLAVSCSVNRGRSWWPVEDEPATGLIDRISSTKEPPQPIPGIEAETPEAPEPFRANNPEGRRLLHREHWLRFLERVPNRVRARTETEWGPLVLLRLYARCPRSEDLFDHDRELVHLLAVHWFVRRSRCAEWTALTEALTGTRLKLLEFAGMPARRAVQRALREVGRSLPHLASARAAVALLNVTGFVEAIALDRWVADWRYSVFNDLEAHPEVGIALRETGYSPRIWASARFQETMAMAVSLSAACGGAPEFLQLQRLEGKWRLDPDRLARFRVPQPPWDGTDTIVPLRTVADVREEGEEMENCLGNHVQLSRILRGEMYVYRVFAPMRATMALNRVGDRFDIDGPLGKRNATLATWVVESVLRQVPDSLCQRAIK